MRNVAFAVLTFLMLAPALWAQEVSVPGTVLGPDGQPIPELRVVLHRVDGAGGATIAETASGPDGGFVLNAEATEDTAAIYFLAARWDGELYIGEPFRPVAGARPQVLQVGIPGTSASALLGEASGDGGAAMPVMPSRVSRAPGWLLVLIPLLGVGAAILYFLLPRQRPPEDRALYRRVAEIDERLVAAPEGQRQALHEERSRLVQQIRTG